MGGWVGWGVREKVMMKGENDKTRGTRDESGSTNELQGRTKTRHRLNHVDLDTFATFLYVIELI